MTARRLIGLGIDSKKRLKPLLRIEGIGFVVTILFVVPRKGTADAAKTNRRERICSDDFSRKCGGSIERPKPQLQVGL